MTFIIAVLWLVAAAVFCAGASAAIAQTKGYDPYPWMLMGALFGPLAILAVGFLPEEQEDVS